MSASGAQMDAARWYYLDGQQSVGPFLWERLMELSKAAIIGPNTFVWREGTKDWVSLAGAIQARQSTPTPPPPPLPIVPKPSERIGSVAADPPPKHSPEVRVPSASPV